MTLETKEIILRALEIYRGDDLERAQAAFKNLSPELMQQQYGQSGKTRQEIIDGYRNHVNRVEAAIREVKKL